MTRSERYGNDSASEYDSDSWSDDLSPTDGYFSPSERPRQLFTTPSSSSGRDSKADENARESAQASRSLSVASPPRQEPEPSSRTEYDPLLDRDGPPPAYSAAISSPYVPQSSGQSSPPPQMGRPTSYGSMGYQQPPQSMADAPPSPFSDDPLLYASPKRQRIFSRRGVIKGLLIAFGLLLFLSILLKTTFRDSGSDDSHQESPSPKIPSDRGPPGEVVDWPDTCPPPTPIKIHKRNIVDVDYLFIKDNTDSTSGSIRVVQGPPYQTAGIHLVVSMTASKPYEVDGFRFLGDERGALMIDSPALKSSSYASYWRSLLGDLNGPCLWTEIIISLKPGLELNELGIQSMTLPVHIEELDLKVTNTTVRVTKGASVEATNFSSRRTTINVDKGSIKGSYALRDLLSLNTDHGSIDVDVSPKEADKDDPQPATFHSSSDMGSTKVEFDVDDPPKRDYQTDMHGSFGSIKATLLHGSSTKASTDTGSIDLDVFPAYAGKGTTHLETVSDTGKTKVVVHQGVYDTFPNINSRHTADKGSLELKYPQAWEGKIEGTIDMGTMHIEGKDVEIIRQRRNKLKAKKGNGQSFLKFVENLGSVSLTVGDRI